jgi:PAS domain S-box-containing protein
MAVDAQFRLLAEGLQQLVFLATSIGRLEWANRRAAALIGLPADRALALADAIHPDDRATALAAWQAGVDGGEPFALTCRLRRRDGGHERVRFRVEPVRSDAGGVDAWLAVGDVDDPLAGKDERIDAALAGSGVGTFFWDQRTDALTWDENLTRLFGLPRGAAPRSLEGFLALVHPDDRAEVLERCRRSVREGADFEMEFRVVWPDGSLHWIDDRGRTFVDGEGRPTHMAGACVDVTTNKRVEAELRRAHEALSESQRRLSVAAQVAGVGTFSWDIINDVNEWSPELEALYGVEPGGFGRNYDAWTRFVHPDDLPGAEAAARDSMQSGVLEAEWRAVLPDGSTRWLQARGIVIKDSDGRPVQMIGANFDVTDRKRLELERERLLGDMRAQGEQLKMLYQHTPLPITVIEGDELRYTMVNDGYRALVGCDPLGRPLLEAFPQLAGTRIYELIRKVYTTGEPISVADESMPMRRADGTFEERWFTVSWSALRAPDGRVRGVLSVGYDVTAQVQARRALEHAREAAEEANRAKDEFLALLGHELRNPLAPILTALQLIKMRGNDPFAREHLVIDRQVQHVTRLVDDLLDVSRVTRGKVTLSLRTVELATIVHKAVEIATPILEKNRQVFICDVPERGLPVDVDPIRIAQVLSNLLTNAAKYSPPGSRVTLRAHREGDEIVAAVEDTGHGIEAELLPRIFEPFVQSRESPGRSPGGLGLGLTVVRNLVKQHGGRVVVESAGPGRGSTFTVRLPRSRGAPASEVAAATAPAASPRNVRVLVVDDNEDAGQLLVDVLQLLGYEARTAVDGPSALEAARAFTPDVALLDIGLPVMDGYELAAQLRAEGQRMPLVALTGYGQESDRRRSTDAGFAAHLVKPIDVDRLAAVLAELSHN